MIGSPVDYHGLFAFRRARVNNTYPDEVCDMDPEEAQLGVQMHAPRRLYYPDMQPIQLDWIAEGTDGKLYLVPAEAGGWLRRRDYQGPYDELAPVSVEKARTISWYVYGDVGTVTIAHA